MNTLNKDFAKRFIDKNIKKNQIMTYTFDFILKKFSQIKIKKKSLNNHSV